MQRKLAVAHVVGLQMCGVKRAARVLGVARSSCYRSGSLMPERASSEGLLVQVSQEHPTLGARKVAALLSLEHGVVLNHKRAARLRALHGLRAPRGGDASAVVWQEGPPCAMWPISLMKYGAMTSLKMPPWMGAR